jgi:hypothetical protein
MFRNVDQRTFAQVIPPLRMYRLLGEDRVATLSTEPAHAAPGSWLIRLVRAPMGKKAKPTTAMAYGPYPTPEVKARWDELVAALEAQGFNRSAVVLSVAELQHKSRKRRAQVALRLGRARATVAVDPLLAALQGATDEACSILDALGWVGDPRAADAIRPWAERKLLSRRRSAVEALRNLGDHVGLAGAAKRGLAELLDAGLKPEHVRLVSEAPPSTEHDPDLEARAKDLVAAVQALPPRQHGRCADVLYELATPRAIAAARGVITHLRLDSAFAWRYVKSALKRAMLRRDHATLGWLIHLIEVRAPETPGVTAQVKSGKDGETRDTPIFRVRTQRWVRRAVWRHLRDLARHRPEEYPRAAAEVLIHYAPADARLPKKRYGEWAHCHLLVSILWSAGQRLERVDRTLRWRFRSVHAASAPVGAREEAFPGLWDARPLAYLRLLSAARLPDVHAFAARAVSERHFDLLHEASTDELVGMIGAPFDKTVELGANELATRWDPDEPYWPLLDKLLRADPERVRGVGLTWLRAAAPLWARDPARALSYLALPAPDARALAAELLVLAIPTLDAEARLALARGILAVLREPEPDDGAHTAHAQVAREALSAELDVLLDVAGMMFLVERGSVSAKTVGGQLLGRRKNALAELGLPRVLALCEHEVASVRAAGHALLLGAIDALALEPGPLFVLAESPWDDTRQAAFGIIKDRLDLGAYGEEQRLDALLALCDSNRADVQAFGREMVLRWFQAVDPRQVMARLAEHPARGVMRRFALDLIEDHLPPGAPALESVARFFSVVLLDVRPERRLKRQTVDFLVRRGEVDLEQARVAAGVLDAWARTSVKTDRERALEALVALRLAWPELALTIKVGGRA